MKILREGIAWIEFLTQLIRENWKGIIFVMMSFWLAMKMIHILFAWFTRRKIIATVNRVDWKFYPKKMRSIYLIFTDKGVLRNEDSWAFLAFNSSDVQGSIQEGKTYEFTIYGMRDKFSSDYPMWLGLGRFDGQDSPL